ncbi:MAG: UDP-N-acetylglucosamine 2-epimerase (non-hydrolyzing) [Casimicrobiaceae bacterium]
MAPVIARLRRAPQLRTTLIDTGQHRDLLTATLALFDLVADVDLALMQPAQGLAEFSSRCLAALDIAFASDPPDAVIAQGDTSTVMMAALAAFYRHIPFFHVEAGLRTGDMANPFPEELNRVIATRIAALHFAPTCGARANLLREGVADERIVVTGNTVIDALLAVRDRHVAHGVPLPGNCRLIVVTSHRRESFGVPLRNTLRALVAIADSHPDVRIVYPAHPNPRVRDAIDAELRQTPSIAVIEPLDYARFVSLLDASTLILTDSGGIQEEAPALHKPVLVLRDDTERPEAVAAGVARMVGTDTARIVTETARLLDDPAHYAQMSRGGSPYGDGHSAARIVERIVAYLEAPAADRHPR